MMATQEFLKRFEETNALLKGHFELSSGKHSDEYFQCALVLQYPKHAEALAGALASKFKDEKITCVIGPALGGVTFAYEVGRQLGVRAIFAERKEGKMELRRGFSLSPTDRVLIVEDVVTTGGSILEVAELLEKMKVPIAGFGAIVDRSGGKKSFPYPLQSLVQMTPRLFDPAQCPLCAAHSPIDKPGSKKVSP